MGETSGATTGAGVRWRCFTCQEVMVEEKVAVFYLGNTLAVPGMVCPDCGAVYLTEQAVVKVINRQERLWEDVEVWGRFCRCY